MVSQGFDVTYTEEGIMSHLPHQVQKVMDIQVDDSDMQTYVKVPTLRKGKWTRTSMSTLIRVAARRAAWRQDISDSQGDDDE